MSECVVRMEMPKSCPCDLIGDGYDLWCSATSGIPQRVAEYYECIKNGTKPDWCPIICQLPEGHGRLIDAEKLKANKYHSDITNENAVAVAEIDWAETIVPAERSET